MFSYLAAELKSGDVAVARSVLSDNVNCRRIASRENRLLRIFRAAICDSSLQWGATKQLQGYCTIFVLSDNVNCRRIASRENLTFWGPIASFLILPHLIENLTRRTALAVVYGDRHDRTP